MFSDAWDIVLQEFNGKVSAKTYLFQTCSRERQGTVRENKKLIVLSD